MEQGTSSGFHVLWVNSQIRSFRREVGTSTVLCILELLADPHNGLCIVQPPRVNVPFLPRTRDVQTCIARVLSPILIAWVTWREAGNCRLGSREGPPGLFPFRFSGSSCSPPLGRCAASFSHSLFSTTGAFVEEIPRFSPCQLEIHRQEVWTKLYHIRKRTSWTTMPWRSREPPRTKVTCGAWGKGKPCLDCFSTSTYAVSEWSWPSPGKRHSCKAPCLMPQDAPTVGVSNVGVTLPNGGTAGTLYVLLTAIFCFFFSTLCESQCFSRTVAD